MKYQNKKTNTTILISRSLSNKDITIMQIKVNNTLIGLRINEEEAEFIRNNI